MTCLQVDDYNYVLNGNLKQNSPQTELSVKHNLKLPPHIEEIKDNV